MREDLVRVSKTVSHALRHAPAQYGLTLDGEGWVSTQGLLAALHQRHSAWRNLRESDLADMMVQSEKQRFEMRDGKIRAFYGHSIVDKIERDSVEPPTILYHGTTPQAARAIQVEGLKPMRRQYVHLSADRETAQQVALRRTDRPVILQVSAFEAHEAGVHFYLGNDMVWLADPIPPTFIH
jgi:putative RNA 2'-phosphotransferase